MLDAADLAEASRDDELAADVWSSIAYLRRLEHFDAPLMRIAARRAFAASERVGGQGMRRARAQHPRRARLRRERLSARARVPRGSAGDRGAARDELRRARVVPAGPGEYARSTGEHRGRAASLRACIGQLATDGTRAPTYYANESAGIAAGFFIAAIHNLGLVTLTHTPSPMGFLSEILERPNTEKPYLLMPVGYPADGATIPDIPRKPLPEVLYWR